MKTKKPASNTDGLKSYYTYMEQRIDQDRVEHNAQKVGYDQYTGGWDKPGAYVNAVPAQPAVMDYEEAGRPADAPKDAINEYMKLKAEIAMQDAPSYNWWDMGKVKINAKAPEPEPKPWMPFGMRGGDTIKNPKVIEAEEYDKLVANQKPEDWDENKVLINLDALTRTLVAREIAFRGLRIEEGSDDYLELWDSVYDTIFKHKV